MDEALRAFQENERADLLEALEQERERSDMFEKENRELLDTVRTLMLGLDALGAFAMKVAGSRTENGGEEWRESILNKKDSMLDSINGWLHWHEEVRRPKPRRKARESALPANY